MEICTGKNENSTFVEEWDGNIKVLGKMRTVPSLQNRNYQAINTRSQADIGEQALM